MKTPSFLSKLSLMCSTLALGACGGAPVGPAPIAQKLVYRCDRLSQEFDAKVAAGKHVPILVTWSAGERREEVGEDELAQRLLAGAPGQQTWVLGRGGSGKTRLADSMQSKLCAQAATIRVDCEMDLAPRMATATERMPALGLAIADQVGATYGSDIAASLSKYLAGSWILIIDGVDELTPREQLVLRRDLDWLAKSEVPPPHLVRFERPGFDGARDVAQASARVRVGELVCEQVEGVWSRRFKDPKELETAKAWLASKELDRKRKDSPGCRYVYMSTWRDAEMMADLAEDAVKAMEPLGAHLTRADLWGAWIGHRLSPVVANMESGLAWIDRLVAAGATEATPPDLVITVDRCVATARPTTGTPEGACGALLSSPVLHAARNPGEWGFRNRTIIDLALSRWLIARNTDCNMLSTAVANHASLELMAMVVSQTAGRRCLPNLIATVCSRGISADELLSFVDEAVPHEAEFTERVQSALAGAGSACERQVFKSLLAAP